MDSEIIYGSNEAPLFTEHWRWRCNPIERHGSLSYRPPAADTTLTNLTVRQIIGDTRTSQ